jgi:5-methylcytosine-specific restriction endonuclease McrA
MKYKSQKTRKEWIKTLDDLARKVIKARDIKCVRCGKVQNLQMAHVLPKGKYTRLRWDSDNLLLLCWYCHFTFAHKNPLMFTEWFKKKYPERFKFLKLRDLISWKGSSDYAGWELLLKSELKKYEN